MFLETKTVLGGPAAGACGCLRVSGATPPATPQGREQPD